MKRYVWSLAMALCLPGAALVAQDEAPGNGHGNGNGNGNGHGNGRGGPPPAHGRDLVDARTRFVRPDPAIDEDAAGDIRMKEHRGRIAIHVHVKHLDQGAVYDVAIARGEESEALGSITIVQDDDGDDREPGPRCHMASLTGDQAVPPVETLAAGEAIVVLTGRDRTTLRYEIAVAGLSGPPVAAHIHLGPPGGAGPVVHPLDHVELRGRVELSEEDLADLDAGNFYINVHTEANPAGEIRGQIVPCDEDDAEVPDDLSGNGKLRIDTQRGDSLPLGAESLADLVGTTVSVADADGAVVLSGDIVDLLKHNPGRQNGQSRPDDGDGDAGDGGAGDGGAASHDNSPVFEETLFVVAGRHDASFLRGDVNGDGSFNISDPIRALGILFQGGELPYCLDAPDANDDGQLDLSDPVAMLIALFRGGPDLAPPAAGISGFDRTGDSLFCEE